MESSDSGASREDAITHRLFIKTLHSRGTESISSSLRFSPPRVEVSLFSNHLHEVQYKQISSVCRAKSLSLQTDSHLLCWEFQLHKSTRRHFLSRPL